VGSIPTSGTSPSRTVHVSRIDDPRPRFDEAQLKELAESIARDGVIGGPTIDPGCCR
jgi:hypothetical protein